MKINDLYESEFLTDKDKILEWMGYSFHEFKADNLVIDSDGLTYYGDLQLNQNVDKLKVQFKLVYGNFNCSHSQVNNLEGFPKKVTKSFYCDTTKINSLVGSPEYVGGDYYSTNTRITDLIGCTPRIGIDFNCNTSDITSLKGCPQSVNRNFYCFNIKITDPKEYRFALYCEIGGEFISSNEEIDNIISTYGGSVNKRHWAKAINLLSKVKL